MKFPRFGLFGKSKTVQHPHQASNDRPVSSGRRRHSKTGTTTKAARPRRRSITYYASANKSRLYPPELFPSPPLGVSSMRRSSTGAINHNTHSHSSSGVATTATHTKLVPLRANLGGDGHHDIVWVPEHQIADIGAVHLQSAAQRGGAVADRVGAPFVPAAARAADHFAQAGLTAARWCDLNANGAPFNAKSVQHHCQYQRQPLPTSAIVPYVPDVSQHRGLMSSSLANANYHNNSITATNCLSSQMVAGEWAQQQSYGHRQQRAGLAAGAYGPIGSGSFSVGGAAMRFGLRQHHRRKKVFLLIYFVDTFCMRHALLLHILKKLEEREGMCHTHRAASNFGSVSCSESE